MTTVGKPIGEHARWRTLYDMLCRTEINGIVTYGEMAAELGLDPVKERAKIQMAMRRAAEVHEREDKRALDVVKGEGYRVVPANENAVLARRHQRKAGKSLVRGHSKAVNADFASLEPDERAVLETIGRAFAYQMDINRRFAVNHERLRQVVAGVETKQDRTAEEVKELRERLDRLVGNVETQND